MPLSSLISFPGGVERHTKDYIRAPAGNALHDFYERILPRRTA